MRDAAWADSYRALIDRLPELARNARTTLCGFSVCVDVYFSLHDVADTLRREGRGSPAEAILDELERRAIAGVGGELAVDWPAGPQWIDAHLSGRRGIGGTGAQAAQMLALLGAPALLALADRSTAQLSVIHPDVTIATQAGAVRRSAVPASGVANPPHYIFEYTAGRPVGGRPVARSSRTIVRFHDSALERDPDFESLSIEIAASAGAGIVCGFNEVAPERCETELDYAETVARAWRQKGLKLIHLELGDFAHLGTRQRTIDRLMPVVTSVGMSLSELNALKASSTRPELAAVELGERFELSRVCIHADEWALAATREDPARELEALQTGCLLASARASTGAFTVPSQLPDGAQIRMPPEPLLPRRDGWQVVRCPAPYLEKPAATIGLGDTFLAGTLLVLGGRAAATSNPERPRHP
jgi:ADP-dependent phosphofructokinase/glucokinase